MTKILTMDILNVLAYSAPNLIAMVIFGLSLYGRLVRVETKIEDIEKNMNND